MIIIDGKATSTKIKESIKIEVDKLENAPLLVAIQVGDNPASSVYVKNKVKSCEKCGFKSEVIKLPEDISETLLIEEVYKLNKRDDVNGFIVQLPLPKHINEQHIIEAIDPIKDVDGFTPINLGRLMIGEDCYEPATPSGIMDLLAEYNIETKGKKVVIVGRSNIVGKPLANLMLHKGIDATVTVCHSKTPQDELINYLMNADIIIAAVGIPKFIKVCKSNAVIIDVGINRIDDPTTKTGKRLVGDVDFDAISEKTYAITPVPGGVGPMTVCSLMKNALKAYKKQHNIE
jgi:methylenetetrahydrofolate dehydrogenase (NADP+) / methenyltetrahydrofolate cyclohydrolase